MKYSKFLFYILTAGFLVLGLYACNKRQSLDTPLKKIKGRWKLIQFATDNGSSFLNYYPVSKEQDWQWVFNEDGTGYDVENWNSTGIRENFNFRITGSDSLWVGTVTHDTTTYHIVEINAKNMRLTWKDVTSTGNPVIQGFYFAKN